MRIKPLLPQLLLILSLFFITSNVTFAQKSKDKKKDKKAEESADSSLVEHQKKLLNLLNLCRVH
jgi:hypothetical protein